MANKEYRAIYKCRLCGKTFENGITSVGVAVGITGRLLGENEFAQGNIYGSRYAIHSCEDDSCGFADFQGFRKISEDE